MVPQNVFHRYMDLNHIKLSTKKSKNDNVY
jgi:hypothetical protein